MGRAVRRCNWCGDENTVLFKDKPYCVECAQNSQKECSACHKPYPDLKYFALNLNRCNSCQKKMEKSKLKKEMEKRGEEDAPRRKKGNQKVVTYDECGMPGPSEEEEEDGEYFDGAVQSEETQQQQQYEDEEDSGMDLGTPPTKKRKKRNAIVSSSSDEESDVIVAKKKKSPPETLLNYMTAEQKKHHSSHPENQKRRK